MNRKFYTAGTALDFSLPCCGILTIELSSSFSRRFCSIGQNGMFSMGQNPRLSLLYKIFVSSSRTSKLKGVYHE